MKCERCFGPHEGDYGSGRFCSQICARGFSTSLKREQINTKVSEALKGSRSPKKGEPQSSEHIAKRLASFTQEKRAIASEKRRQTFASKLISMPFDTSSWGTKRKRIILEQNGKCLHCGISEWQGKPIVIEVDHIDGNKSNNDRSNLRGLCPNCHSQTETWKRKK